MAERLAYILKKRDKTAADLARATKKTESAVSQWLNGLGTRIVSRFPQPNDLLSGL